MNERDPDAWWSPVPGWAEPALDPRSAPPAAGPTWPPGPPAVPQRRRWTWVLSASAASLLVVCAVLALAFGRPGTTTLMDPAGTVSVAVPGSWYDNTGDPGSDPDEPPVLAASNLWQIRWMEVDRFDVDDTDDLWSFHTEGVDHECASWTCTHRSGPERL
ncbi:MAG: hypothetical protein ACRYG2_33825, partial [Janthinobacterium lividum]